MNDSQVSISLQNTDPLISELSRCSKWEWLFAVFELYYTCCNWKSLHDDFTGLDSLEKRQVFLQREKNWGLPHNGTPARYRWWNKLAGLTVQLTEQDHQEYALIELLSPGVRGVFEDYVKDVHLALGSPVHGSIKELPEPAIQWIQEAEARILEKLQDEYLILNDFDRLSGVLFPPAYDWEMDSPLDRWPDGRFELDCYYYASLFAHWLQNEPLFFSRLGNQTQSKVKKVEPGELRTLLALKQESPHGLTVKDLAPLTKKDFLSEDTPRGSLDVWLKNLKEQGLVVANDERPKKWFFVKDYES